MRTRSIAVPLLAAAVGTAGCGTSSRPPNTATTPPTGVTAVNGGIVPDAVYRVTLTGAAELPKAALHGGGRATITMSTGKHQLCWKFALTGVPAPTVAHIHAAARGTAGPIYIPLGPAYAPNGCTSAVTTAQLTQIVAAPAKFYLNVHDKAFPNGAVRAQL